MAGRYFWIYKQKKLISLATDRIRNPIWTSILDRRIKYTVYGLFGIMRMILDEQCRPICHFSLVNSEFVLNFNKNESSHRPSKTRRSPFPNTHRVQFFSIKKLWIDQMYLAHLFYLFVYFQFFGYPPMNCWFFVIFQPSGSVRSRFPNLMPINLFRVVRFQELCYEFRSLFSLISIFSLIFSLKYLNMLMHGAPYRPWKSRIQYFQIIL